MPALTIRLVTFAGVLLTAALTNANAQVSAPVSAEVRNAIALQLALERTGFSPGLIDGKIGPKTTLALTEFQRSRRLPATGRLDDATRGVLRLDEAAAFSRYTITAADKADVGPNPTGWVEKSKLDRLRYPSLATLVAEKAHCPVGLLATLNPRVNVNALVVGTTLVVPNAAQEWPKVRAARLELNLNEKVIRAYGADGKLAAIFHCSIAAKKEKLPSGQAEVVRIAEDPTYTFDPDMWPEVKNVRQKLTIPPGPRNPVGVRWIGLGLPGVGMHGTPNPELIGKTGSHGCIRLTNWDAVRLAGIVTVGTPVRFLGGPGVRVAEADKR